MAEVPVNLGLAPVAEGHVSRIRGATDLPTNVNPREGTTAWAAWNRFLQSEVMRVINADPERNQLLHFLWARMEMLQGQQAEGDVYVRDLLQWAQNLQGEQAQHQYQILHFVLEMVSRA